MTRRECQRLITGRLFAVDRSPVAVERTTRRNAGPVADGRLTGATAEALRGHGFAEVSVVRSAAGVGVRAVNR